MFSIITALRKSHHFSLLLPSYRSSSHPCLSSSATMNSSLWDETNDALVFSSAQLSVLMSAFPAFPPTSPMQMPLGPVGCRGYLETPYTYIPMFLNQSPPDSSRTVLSPTCTPLRRGACQHTGKNSAMICTRAGAADSPSRRRRGPSRYTARSRCSRLLQQLSPLGQRASHPR
jgi:hypothetical protein